MAVKKDYFLNEKKKITFLTGYSTHERMPASKKEQLQSKI